MRLTTLKSLLAVLTLALCAQGGRGQSTSARPAECPALQVSCPEASMTGTPAVFTIEHAPLDGVTYEWVVSAGTITSGQGTRMISVDTTGLGNGYVTATVEAKGLPPSCPNSSSCSASVLGVIGCGRPLDEYGDIRFNDEMARLDNLAIELQNNPEAGGHIICYGGRVGRAGEARRRCDRAKNYIVTRRGIEAARIVAEDGGHRENLTVTSWVVPAGETPPAASPTVDPREVKIIRGRTKARARRR